MGEVKVLRRFNLNLAEIMRPIDVIETPAVHRAIWTHATVVERAGVQRLEGHFRSGEFTSGEQVAAPTDRGPVRFCSTGMVSSCADGPEGSFWRTLSCFIVDRAPAGHGPVRANAAGMEAAGADRLELALRRSGLAVVDVVAAKDAAAAAMIGTPAYCVAVG